MVNVLFFTQSPLDLTKVRLQASGDKRMIESIKKTVRTAGMIVIDSFPLKKSNNTEIACRCKRSF